MENVMENIFLQTLDSNKDRIFRICRSYSTEPDDANDLFQEVVMNIWKSLPQFNNQSNIDTWVFRITINVCLKAKQFSDKKHKHFVKLDSISYENIGEKINSNENEELFLKLSKCIEKLEGAKKSIILLYLEDLPYKEIASIIGVTENHVAVKIKRIKNKLLICINS